MRDEEIFKNCVFENNGQRCGDYFFQYSYNKKYKTYTTLCRNLLTGKETRGRGINRYRARNAAYQRQKIENNK